MRFLSLFAGVGGFDLGLERSGHECIGQVEIDPFCRRVLERHWPHVARWSDVREWQGHGDESVDLVCGGSPCQAFSIAGLRKSLSDDRGNLVFEFLRVCNAANPAWIIWENVPGVLSTQDNAFGCFLAAMVGADAPLISPLERGRWSDAGMVAGPQRAAAWRCLDSQHFGVAQRRRRVFLIAGPSIERLSQILFEPESRCGYPAPGKETGEKVAGGTTDRIAATLKQRGRGATDEVMDNLQLIEAYQCHGSNVGKMGTLRQGNGALTGGVPFVTHTLTGEGFDASEDGTGRGTPLAFQPKASSTQSMNPSTIAPSLGTTKEVGVIHHGVRRLTVVECSRLQGFPDDWCCLCGANENLDACTCPDSPRYRALGNAVTVSVIEWLGGRLNSLS